MELVPVTVEELGLTLLWEFPIVRHWTLETTNKYYSIINDVDYHFTLLKVEGRERFHIAKNPYGQRIFDTPLYYYLKRNFPSVEVTPYGLVFDERDTVMIRMFFG
jgi:hypothetical protein